VFELPQIAVNTLFKTLNEAGLHRLDVKDIICAAVGFKVARISGDNHRATLIKNALAACGIDAIFSDQKFLSGPDLGKGKWSNYFRGTIGPNSSDGVWKIYVSRSQEVSNRAKTFDMMADHESLGQLLGIPECCRRFYLQYAPQAAKEQTDLLPFIFRNTHTAGRLNFWLNYGARYFGYSLLSFAPCSFQCAKAAEVAQQVWAIVATVSQDLADTFITYQKRTVLYTEYSGVFLLDAIRASGDRVFYRAIRATEKNTTLAQALLRGNAVHTKPGGHISILKDEAVLLETSKVGCILCIF
jgi:hypothetical protein